MRVKSKWHKKDQPKTVEQVAGVLAFNAWRIASSTVNQLYSKGFDFSSNAQQLAVIGEFIAFLIQATDRLAYERLEGEARQKFVTTLALKLVDTLNDNLVEELGPGEYREGYLQKLNERLASYSEFSFPGGEPGYQSLRFLGKQVDEIMGGTENRWVLEQIVEIEAPNAFKTLQKNLSDLFAQGVESD